MGVTIRVSLVTDANEKSQTEGIMPETMFTAFPVLSVDPRVGISLSALEIDGCYFS